MLSLSRVRTSARASRHAGMMPMTRPLIVSTANPKSSTVVSTGTDSRRGSVDPPSSNSSRTAIAASAKPRTVPAAASTIDSVTNSRMMRPWPAPSALRRAISRVRPTPRASKRFVTLTHANASSRSGRAERDQQHGTQVADERPDQRLQDPLPSVGTRHRPGQLLHRGVADNAQLVDGGARLQPHNDVEDMSHILRRVAAVEPEVHPVREVGERRRDADDGDAHSKFGNPYGLADNGRVAAEQTRPRRVRDDE